MKPILINCVSDGDYIIIDSIDPHSGGKKAYSLTVIERGKLPLNIQVVAEEFKNAINKAEKNS